MSADPVSADFDPWPWCDKRFPEVAEAVGTQGLENVGTREQALYVLYMLVGQVWNGGLRQYYESSSGDDAVLAQSLLHEVGAETAAAILRAANARFPGGGPEVDQDKRAQQLERLGFDAFHELDRRFVDDNPDDIHYCIYSYWTRSEEGEGQA